MSVFNLAWHNHGFFWDGRSDLLRHQSLLPIQDPLEMDETLENVISKLSASPSYLDFNAAFQSTRVLKKRYLCIRTVYVKHCVASVKV